jgi:gliding motility-associated-like protein
LSAGNYTVIVTDASGCTATSVFTITEPAPITASATSVPACGLNNGSATASVTSGGTAPFTFSWAPSGGTNATALGLSAGNYTCVITDANGCTQTVSVNVVTNPIPTADAGADVTVSLGNNTVLTATGGGTYSWSTGETTSSITVAPTATASYCVWVTNSAGCTDSACVLVSVDVNCGELFVPNAFSPNNDGENDVLQIFGGCIRDLQFSIYDRWGEKVFETTNPADAWDGTYKGKVMNTAVFVYRLEAVLLTGESVSKKGNISLVR